MAKKLVFHKHVDQCLTTYGVWWRDSLESFSALLSICVGNSPVTGEFPAQRPVTRNFDVFFDLHLNERLPSRPKSPTTRLFA